MSTSIAEAPNGALLSFIERAARDPEFDVQKFALLLDKQQEMLRERARQEFNAAMAIVDTEIGPVLRDRLNPAFNRKYATLEAIDAVARPVYSKNGFSVRFGCDKPPNEGWMRITCTVSHAGGYSEQNYLDSRIDESRGRTSVQAIGSTITYLRRYLLQMAFNIVLADDEEDDDGNGAGKPHRIATPTERREAPLKKQTLKEWLADFQRDTEAARTPEEASRVLDAAHALMSDFLASRPEARAQYEAIRAACIARLWPEPPDDLPEVQIIGEERLGAG